MRLRVLFYGIAVLLVIAWAMGTFYWQVGGWVHLLLIMAIIAILFGVIQKA